MRIHAASRWAWACGLGWLAVVTVRPVGAADDSIVDDIPGAITAFVRQWDDDDITPAVRSMLADNAAFGRLRPGGARALSLNDCVALALAYNTGLQIARLGPLGARAEIRRANAVFDPAVFAETEARRSTRPASSQLQGATTARENTFDVTLGTRKVLQTGGVASLAWNTRRLNSNSAFLSLRPQYTSDLILSLNQPLLRNFGRRFSTLRVRIARVAESGARKQYESSLADLVRGVEEAYWAVIGAAEFVRAQEQGVLAARELLRQNEGKFAVGTVPRTAVLEAQAELARREADLIQAQNLSDIAVDALRAVINAPAEDERLLINVAPTDTPEVEPIDLNLDRSLERALESRAEIEVARLDLERSAMQLALAENQLLPRLDAVGSVGTNGLAGRPRQTQLPFPGEDPVENPFAGSEVDSWGLLVDGRYYSYVAGVKIEVPLDNAQARADYSLGRVNVDRARLELRRLQEEITLQVKRAATNLETDLKSINARRVARELAEENVRNQQARYDVGLATTKDLLDFQDFLTQARAAEIRALTQYRIDLAELRRVEGTLLRAHDIEFEEHVEEGTPWWARF